MTIHNLDSIFEPKSVAVVGASDREGSIGHAILRNLLKGGFQGKLCPVNPRYEAVQGIQAYASVTAIGEPVDMAVIATPIATVDSILRECGEAGVKGAVIISAGGKETGSQGRDLEGRIAEEARKAGLRVIGPNCLGVVNTQGKLNATFAGQMPLPGKLALVSQSGAICTAILDWSINEHIGFSHFVSIGSMLDVDFGDLVDYLGNDPRVSSILLYVESLVNFRQFMSAARAVSRLKPIVVLKSGRSGAGARAASSHTGAMAGEDAVYDAAFERAGIIRVDSILQLFDCAELMAKQPRPRGPRLAVITNAGGPGVMAADALANYGLEPAVLNAETLRKLDEALPPFWSRSNPVDLLGDADAERYRRAVEICVEAREVDALLIVMAPQALASPTGVARELAGTLKGRRISVFTSWMGGAGADEGRRLFNEASIPTYDTPEQAVRAFQYMYRYGRNLEALQEIPPKLPEALRFDRDGARPLVERGLERDNGLLTEKESKDLLSAYGIRVNVTEVASSEEEAVELARSMGFPVALKVHSPDVVHKSDAHGVELNLRRPEGVVEAFRRIEAGVRAYDPRARFEGVSVQPMVESCDYELILGAKRDKDFGPVILFGLGGVMTEVFRDRAIALPPLNRLLARRLMESTRIHRLLTGYRNRPAANMLLLEETLIRLSQLVTDFPEIVELDMNPVVLVGEDLWAVDARVVVKPSDVPSPMHLVVSPYPNEYEERVVTDEGVEIFVRPIKPEDAPLLTELFGVLSPRSIYYRFMSPMKELPRPMVVRFTQIDYDRDICLVAIEEDDGAEKMLAVARVMGDPDGVEAEFAVLVGDPWQGKGIGAELLQRCLNVARKQGFRKIVGTVLAENTHMLALGRKLGFTLTRTPGAGEYELKMDLKG